jgi:hypothetical protein
LTPHRRFDNFGDIVRIGLIQAGGIGDIIIALPIADYFIERGCEVFWPVEDRHAPVFQPVKPEVHFIPIPGGQGLAYDTPLNCLKELGCDPIFPLISYLDSKEIYDKGLSNSLKFDEYKYAIAGVPFSKKWELRIRRDPSREAALKERLEIRRPYICVHRHASNWGFNLAMPKEWTEQYQIIEVSPMTDSPFDWIGTLEGAAKLVLIDSCFANLVEQLNIPGEKFFLLRSPIQFTPVMKNGWRFLSGSGGDGK